MSNKSTTRVNVSERRRQIRANCRLYYASDDSFHDRLLHIMMVTYRCCKPTKPMQIKLVTSNCVGHAPFATHPNTPHASLNSPLSAIVEISRSLASNRAVVMCTIYAVMRDVTFRKQMS